MNKIFTIFMILFVVNVYAGSLEERLINPQTQKEAIKEIQKEPERYTDELKSIIQINRKAYRKQLSGKKVNEKVEDKDHAKIAATLLLGRLKIDSARETIESNLEKDENEFVREASALAVMEMYSIAETEQKKTIKNRETNLSKIQDDKINASIKALTKALEDKSGNVRMRAVLALARIKHNIDAQTLDIENLKRIALDGIKSKNATESLLAIDAIEAIQDKSLIQILNQNLESKNIWCVIHSKIAIKKLEIQDLADEDRIKILSDSLRDNQFEVSKWAAIELGKMKTKEAEEILNKAAEEGLYTARKINYIKGKNNNENK